MRKTIGFCCVFASLFGFPVAALVPGDGAEWEVPQGANTVLPAGAYTNTILTVNGSLTLDSGAILSLTNTPMSYVGTQAGQEASLTIRSGARLEMFGTSGEVDPSSAFAFAVGAAGSFGTLTVESGGELYITKASLGLARNALASASQDRSLNSRGVLNVSGTVDVGGRFETTAWYPTLTTPYDAYDLENGIPQSAIVNLNEGGLLAVHFFQFDDAARAIINCNGGTVKAKKSHDNFNNGNCLQLWTIASGKKLIIDSNGFNIRFQKSSYRDDFVQIVGDGGLQKKGQGHLALSIPGTQNRFTGPIVVEEGSFSLGRRLAPGQTVFVKAGAVFYPTAGDDLALITYENPAERPNEAVYTINNEHWEGLDFTKLAPNYGLYAIATGPNLATVRGPVVVPGDVDCEKPFGITTRAGVNINFYNTGLDAFSLALSGSGLAYFGAGTVVGDQRSFEFIENATLQFNGEFVISNAQMNATAPARVTIVGAAPKTGTLKTGLMRVGHEGHGGELYVTNANVAVSGELRIGGNVSVRHKFPAHVEVVNGTLSATSILLSPMCMTDGTDYNSIMSSLYLGPGSVVTVGDHFQRNDDPRARVTFGGGQCVALKCNDDFIGNYQEGVFEWMAAPGANLDFSIGTNRVGAVKAHTHFFGDGGFYVHGTNPSTAVFLLGKFGIADIVANYKGDTKIENCTLELGGANLLPHGPGCGSVVGVNNGQLNLGGWEQTVNQVSGSLTVKSGVLALGADNSDLTLDPQVKFASNASLAKVGTGTLTVNQPLGGNLDVREGTVEVKGTTKVAYSSYRFKVEKIRNFAMTGSVVGDWNSMQLAEFMLVDGVQDVTRPYARLSYESSSDAASAFPAAETPEKAVDGNLETKWLDFRGAATATAADKDRVWIRLDYGKPHPITGYCWYTANDSTGRDPISWRFQGSNDEGATWTDIDVQVDCLPTTTRRELAYASGAGQALGGTAAIRVKPGAKLVVDGGVVALDGVDNQGALELRHGVKVQSRGGVLNGSVQDLVAFDKVGGDVLTLTGDLACTGRVHVAGGTLNVGSAPAGSTRSFDGKFFRLTIQRSNDGGGFQFSEFQLFDADGVVQNGTMVRAANGLPASMLAAGQVSVDKEYLNNLTATNPENVPQGFDGKTSTKWFTGASTDGRPVNYKVLVMRLPASAKPICSYNFFTANDYVRRSPADWILEGSYDGVNWIELDRRCGAPHTAFDNKNNFSAAVIREKPFNNGAAFTFSTETPTAANVQYLRFTFKKTVGNTFLQMSELRVFDNLGNNVAKGLVKASDAIDATALEPGSFSRGGAYSEGGSNGSEGFAMLFDDNPDSKLCAVGNNMAGATANYRVITMRLPFGVTSILGYDWLTANDSLNRSPCDWAVEGSVDGISWTMLDERTGVAQPFCLYASGNHGRLFTFAKLDQGGGSLDAGELQVDAGATLALNNETATIKNLVLDWSRGGGTLLNFRPATKGQMTIGNIPEETDLEGLVLPYMVQNPQSTANLTSWTVWVEGMRGTYDVRLNAENKLFIRRHIGSTIYFR